MSKEIIIAKKKIAAYVPIKLNNARTPGKNIKPFDDGTPLCQFMFNSLKKVDGIDEIYCFCSDERIQEYLPAGIKFLKRNPSLDTAETQCQDLIKAFTETVEADIYVLCHVTSPFLKASSIKGCLEAVLSGKYDSAFTGSAVRDFLWENGRALNFDPENSVKTQELPDIYKETVGCYVFTQEVFRKRNGKVGYHPYILQVDEFEALDIDYPNDFAICNAVYMQIMKGREDDRDRGAAL